MPVTITGKCLSVAIFSIRFLEYLCTLLARGNAGQQVFYNREFSQALSLCRDQQVAITPNFPQSCTGCYSQHCTAVVQEGTLTNMNKNGSNSIQRSESLFMI